MATHARASRWLKNRIWRLTIGEWIAVTLSFLAIILIFCLFFIRRHSLPYHFEHTFAVRDPEFVGSALGLDDPVLVPGNKIELLPNGDEYFPGREMESVFEKDLTPGARVHATGFQKRSLWERATEWLMIPFRSQF